MGLTGGKAGGKNALAAKPNLLNALQVQTSSYGQVIPVVYGQNRIAGRLLWSGDFQSIAHTSTQKVGGKGLGSGGGNVSQTTYTYQTAVAIALCMGPIQNLGSVWDTKGQLTLLSTSVQFTVPGGGGSFTPTPPAGGIWHSGRGVGRTDAFSLSPNDYGSDGAISLSGNQLTPMVLVSGAPGAGQYTLNAATGQHTFASADAGKVMTITYAYSEPTSNSSTGAPASVLNLTLFTGQRPQTPWSYLTSNHPGQDLGYNGIAYVASSTMDLGDSGALPNLSYEVLGALPFGGGITDAEPGSIINDLLTNPFYGLGAAGNLVLDPGILSVALSGAYWTQSDSLFAKGFGTFTYTGTGAASGFHYAYTRTMSVTPGQQYTLSGFIDATQVTAGSPIWSLFDPTITTNYFSLGQTAGLAGVVAGTWTCPSGVTSVVVLCDTANCTANSGQLLRFARPVFSLGTVAATQVMLDDYTNFSSYCLANGIFLSPVYDSQQTAAQCIQDILDITNAEAVWSEGLLKIKSYGDTTAVGNGAVFSPNTTPIYDLDSSAFLDVVTIKRPSVADVMNDVSVEFVDRSNSYNVSIAEDRDEAQIAIYGLRKAQPKTAHSITTSSVAAFVANLLRKRQIEIRNTYTVKVGWQYALLEPMDLVTLTVPELGYKRKPVRVLALREDDTGQIEMDCEDFPWGTATPTLYAQQAPARFAPQTNSDPGNVNAPIVFEAPVNLSKSGQHEIWMAVSGASPNWGGCSVWVSQDNTEYHQIGKIFSAARMGVTNGSTAELNDPTLHDYFPVDLSQSNGILTAGSQADADSYRTLCYVGGEFISYEYCALASQYHYLVGQLSGGGAGTNYSRRGLFGSVIKTHSPGEPFARLDDAIFTYVYDPSFLGKTIFLKFTSFNTNGLVEQSIANATAYQFVVTGRYCQMETVSKNLLANPGFESNQALTPLSTYPTENFIPVGQRLSDGWTSWNGLGIVSVTGDAYMTSSLETTTARSGNSCLIVLNKSGATLPGDSNFYCMGAVGDKIPVNPGEQYCFGGYIRLVIDGSLPSGVAINAPVRVILYDSQSNVLGQIVYNETGVAAGNPDPQFTGPQSASTFAGGYYLQSTYFTVPATYGAANARPAFAAVWCTVVAHNTGSNWTMSGLQFDCRFDDCFLFPQWMPTSDEIAKQGSMSVTYSGGLTYTSNTSSITWSWNINANRTDRAMSVNNYSGSQAISGLSAGTSYNFYPFIDEVNQVVSMVATGGVGSPAWAHNGTSVAWTQEQARGDHWPLSAGPAAAATTTSGSGGGGSGGGIGGSCLRHDVLVEERRKGVIPVRDLELGDQVRCPQDPDTAEGWAEVIDLSRDFAGTEWVHTHFNCDDWLATTPGHPFTLSDSGAMKRAAELSLEDPIPCRRGVTFPVSHEMARYPARKVRVSVRSRRHVFYAGMKSPSILQHNFEPNS